MPAGGINVCEITKGTFDVYINLMIDNFNYCIDSCKEDLEELNISHRRYLDLQEQITHYTQMIEHLNQTKQLLPMVNVQDNSELQLICSNNRINGDKETNITVAFSGTWIDITNDIAIKGDAITFKDYANLLINYVNTNKYIITNDECLSFKDKFWYNK